MNNAGIHTTNNSLSPIGQQVATRQREQILDNRVEALRELALSLLTELETLGGTAPPAAVRIRLDDEVKRFEIDLIRTALDRARGNQARAARMLGVKHSTLNAKIKRYRLQNADCGLDAVCPATKQEIAA